MLRLRRRALRQARCVHSLLTSAFSLFYLLNHSLTPPPLLVSLSSLSSLLVVINQGAKACAACPAGKFQPGLSRGYCFRCLLGEFQPAAGQQRCRRCRVGRVQPTLGSAACVACAGSNAEGGFAPDEAGAKHCVPCGGAAAKHRAKHCHACPSGRHRDGGLVARVPLVSPPYMGCVVCAAGKHPREQPQSCRDCPGGQFPDARGTGACAACRAGRYLPPPRVRQSAETVAAGSDASTGGVLLDTAAGRAACRSCPPGKFQARPGFSFCAFCASGRYQAKRGASACRTCGRGYRVLVGGTACLPCAAGQYVCSLLATRY